MKGGGGGGGLEERVASLDGQEAGGGRRGGVLHALHTRIYPTPLLIPSAFANQSYPITIAIDNDKENGGT